MNNLKLILPFLSAVILAFLLTGCGEDGKKDKPSGLYEKNTANFDLNSSIIYWTGHKKNGKVEGTLKFSKGFLKLEKGMPVSGTCSIDMNSLKITSITDTAENRELTEYLKSAAFLDTKKYPEALFTMKSIIPLKALSKPEDNTTVKSSLTIKDSTLTTGITALTIYYPDSLSSRAKFSLSGELWNIPLAKIKAGRDYRENPFKEDFDIEVYIAAR